MVKRRSSRNKKTQEKQLSPMDQYREQGELQALHDPLELARERNACRQLLDGDLTWEILFGRQ